MNCAETQVYMHFDRLFLSLRILYFSQEEYSEGQQNKKINCTQHVEFSMSIKVGVPLKDSLNMDALHIKDYFKQSTFEIMIQKTF